MTNELNLVRQTIGHFDVRKGDLKGGFELVTALDALMKALDATNKRVAALEATDARRLGQGAHEARKVKALTERVTALEAAQQPASEPSPVAPVAINALLPWDVASALLNLFVLAEKPGMMQDTRATLHDLAESCAGDTSGEYLSAPPRIVRLISRLAHGAFNDSVAKERLFVPEAAPASPDTSTPSSTTITLPREALEDWYTRFAAFTITGLMHPDQREECNALLVEIATLMAKSPEGWGES